jgi:tRNA (cmo5U34)-methyltransferase
MDAVRQHFNDEAPDFDQIILALIPDYRRIVQTLVAAIPFERTARIEAIDLGCGTGTIAKAILEQFPNARVTCVDLAENMLAIAQSKLGRHSGVEFVLSDFRTLSLDRGYDVVLSSLALHHLVTDEDKIGFYKRIYNGLRNGGVFYNGDIVLGSSDFLQVVYMREWRAFMCRNIAEAEVDDTWIPKYHAEDRPAKLVDQIDWLRKIGFVEVDVLFKAFHFAVYGGSKPLSASANRS